MTYLTRYPDRVLELLRQHLVITAVALGIAMLLAFPLGILVARRRSLDVPVIGALGVIYTIPSLALLAFLIQPFGLGLRPLLFALVIYVQFVLVRNIVVGLRGVDPAILEAARGMGLSSMQSLWQVELPLAAPIILAGVRLATVSIVGLATIGAWIAAGGLGVLFNEGISQDNPDKIQAGVLVIGVLAVALNQSLLWLERRAGRWRTQ
ncbi:MAG: ABC transporter permease [Anaerolineae bacterium]